MKYSVCDEEGCNECICDDRFLCKFTTKDLLYFIIITLTFVIPTFIYFIISGLSIHILIYSLIFLFFYMIGAPLFLCRHCKYYKLTGKFIKCPGHYGAPKFFKYTSKPLAKFEKALVIIVFILLFGYPLIITLLNKNIPYTILIGWSVFQWFYIMQTTRCSKCPNFSCPMNKVDKRIRETFNKKSI